MPENFLEALCESPLADTMTESVRRIEWGEGADRVVLEYDLRQLR